MASLSGFRNVRCQVAALLCLFGPPPTEGPPCDTALGWPAAPTHDNRMSTVMLIMCLPLFAAGLKALYEGGDLEDEEDDGDFTDDDDEDEDDEDDEDEEEEGAEGEGDKKKKRKRVPEEEEEGDEDDDDEDNDEDDEDEDDDDEDEEEEEEAGHADKRAKQDD